MHLRTSLYVNYLMLLHVRRVKAARRLYHEPNGVKLKTLSKNYYTYTRGTENSYCFFILYTMCEALIMRSIKNFLFLSLTV